MHNDSILYITITCIYIFKSQSNQCTIRRAVFPKYRQYIYICLNTEPSIHNIPVFTLSFKANKKDRIKMGEWQNGLFGCFTNCGVCIMTYFLPCLTAGHIAEKVGKPCCLYGFLAVLGPVGIYTRAKTREMVRDQKGIEVSGFSEVINRHCPRMEYIFHHTLKRTQFLFL